MQHIGDNLNRSLSELIKIRDYRPPTKFAMACRFMNKLNEGRYEQDHLEVKRMLRTLKCWHTNELYALWKDCEGAKNFSAYFWYRIGMREQQIRDGIIKIVKKPKQVKIKWK